MTTNITTKLRTVTTVIALTCFLTGAVAQVKNEEKSEGKQKDEDNRNVMLNAASANGPREIQIGLPMSDVNVLENGLPITYATNPRSVNSIWRSDASFEHVGLLKISETAITTGNIGYAVNSYTKLGKEGFQGTLNYKTNHFGLQEFSLTLMVDLATTGSIVQAYIKTSIQVLSKSNQANCKTAHRFTRL